MPNRVLLNPWPSVIGADSPLPRRVAIFRSKPLSDLTEQDYSDLAALVREAIDAEPYRVGPRMTKLMRLLTMNS